MRLILGAVIPATVVIAGLAPAVTTTPAASVASARDNAHAANGCIAVTATVPVGSFPEGVAVNPKANTVYVTNARDNTVSVISGRTNTVVATIPVGSFPEGVAVNPKTSTVYVTNKDRKSTRLNSSHSSI